MNEWEPRTHLSIAHFRKATKLFLSSSAKLFNDDKLLCSNNFNSLTSISSRDAEGLDMANSGMGLKGLGLTSSSTKERKKGYS